MSPPMKFGPFWFFPTDPLKVAGSEIQRKDFTENGDDDGRAQTGLEGVAPEGSRPVLPLVLV